MADTKVRAPFIKIKFVNSDITISDTDVLSLSVKKNYNNSYNEVQFTVREQQGYKISKSITNQKIAFTLSYGDTIQNSQNFYGEVLKYKTEFHGNIMMLSIIGYVTTTDITKIKKQEYKNWSALPEYHNNPSEIVEAICEQNGWEKDEIARTIPLRHFRDSIINFDYVPTNGGPYDAVSAAIPESAWENTVDLIQKDQNDIQFIVDVLCPNSICINNFLLEYKLSLTKKSGKTCLRFAPTKPTRTSKNLFFSYNKSQGTFGQQEVLSFDSGLSEVWSAQNAPDKTRTVKDALSAELGKYDLDTTGLSELNNVMRQARASYIKIYNETAEDNESSQEDAEAVVSKKIQEASNLKQIYNRAADAFFNIFYNDKISTAVDAYQASQKSDNIAKYQQAIDEFGNLAEYKYEASLTTLGNQGLKPGDSLDMLVLMEQGVHYTSGTYFILEQTDKIELGKYTTDYKLMKNTKAFLGSAEELQALGLCLADVYLSEYAQTIVPNITYVANTKMVTTDGDTAKGNVIGDSSWPGTSFKSLYLKDIQQTMALTGSKVKEFPTKDYPYKVAFFDKPYIGQYTSFSTIFGPNYTLTKNGVPNTPTTLNPMVFRCTKEFREKWLTDPNATYYITLSTWEKEQTIIPMEATGKYHYYWLDGNHLFEEGCAGIYNPFTNQTYMKMPIYQETRERKNVYLFREDYVQLVKDKGYVKWFYAGDQYRTATENDAKDGGLICHGEKASYGDLVHVGDSVREGEILKSNGQYITSATVELYVPGNLTSDYYAKQKDSQGEKYLPREAMDRAFRLYKVTGG